MQTRLMRARRAFLWGCATLPLWLAACGGGADESKARVRLVNASAYSALDMRIDDDTRFGSVAYGETGNYVETDPEPDRMDTVITRTGSSSPLVSLTPAVAEDTDYTLLAWGREGELEVLLLDDSIDSPDDDKTLIRIVNAAPDAGDVDVYLTEAGDSLTDAVALQAALAVGAVSDYTTVDSANWRLRVTAAGDKADLRLDVPALALVSGGITTLVITPGRGGVLVNALQLAERESPIVRADATQARVRVAAAVSGSASVSATLAGSTLLDSSAPVVGNYELVGAGTPALAVAVNGSTLPATAPTLQAGADYTLVVHGPPSAPMLSWVEDDNRLPASGQARVRLLHGVAGLDGTLSLAVDFTPLADGVAPGTASAYAAVDPTVTAQLSVSSPGLGAPLFSAIEQTFLADSNYTLFVVGSLDAPTGILRRDR